MPFGCEMRSVTAMRSSCPISKPARWNKARPNQPAAALTRNIPSNITTHNHNVEMLPTAIARSIACPTTTGVKPLQTKVRDIKTAAGMVRSLRENKVLSNHRGSLACRSEEHTSELQSRFDLVCRLLLE